MSPLHAVTALMRAKMLAIDQRTEQRRAKWWSWCNLAIFVIVTRLRVWPWLRRRIERIGRACLRRSMKLHWRRANRLLAIAQRDMRERSLPPILRPSESSSFAPSRPSTRAPFGPVRVSE